MPDGFDLQRLDLDPLGGWLVFVLVSIFAIGVAVWAYGTSPAPLSRGRRFLLGGLRAAALVLLLVMLARPVAVVARAIRGEPEVTILVDQSASMTRADGPGGRTRGDVAFGVADELAASLAGSFRVSIRPFGASLGPEATLAAEMTPDSALATAPGDAVEQLLREPRTGPLVAIVVVSDGAATRGRDLVSTARQLGSPLHTVVVGDSAAVADVQIVGVDVPPAAFVGEPVTVSARLRSTGSEGLELTVRLAGEDGPLEEKRIALSGGGAVTDVRFAVTPKRAGYLLYEVAVREAPEDANALDVNDTVRFALHVRKDRLQVLVVDARPSWDFTFLRRTLERDTTLAYTYLVGTDGDRALALGEERVARFPQHLDEIAAFKAVVLGETNERLPGEAGLELLARFVEAGGGLLVLGGNNEAGVSRFARAPLARVLPVEPIPPPRAGAGSFAMPPLTPRVTVLGDASPLVSLHGDVYENRAAWSDMPPVRPAGASNAARAGAEVLVELLEGDRRFPLVAKGRAGAGRVLYFGGRALWKWKFLREGLDERDELFDRFWIGVMRWLADPEPSARIWVQPARRVFRHGDEVVLGGRALDADLRPLAGARIEATLVSSNDTLAIEPEWGEQGALSFRAGALVAGRYDYEVTVEPPGAPIVRQEGTFVVDRNGPEWWSLSSRPDALRQAAHAASGLAVGPDRANAIAASIRAPRLERVETYESPLWNHPLPVVLFLLVAGSEWWIRRRAGLA